MVLLANMAMDISIENQDSGKPDNMLGLMAEAIVGTGWTPDEFRSLCLRCWNGPSWVQ